MDSKTNDYQLIQLAKDLYPASDFVIKDFGANKGYYIFATPKEWIKVYFPSEIDYYTLKAIPNQIDMRFSGTNNKYALKEIEPKFYAYKKPHSFEKTKKIEADFRINILSTSSPHFSYWLGNGYYKLPIGKEVAKLKLQKTTRKNKISVGALAAPNSAATSNIYIIENNNSQYLIIKKNK